MFTVNRLKSVTEFADERATPDRDVDGMDVDMEGDGVEGVEDLGEGTSMGLRATVVSPGEVITSSKEYMR